MTSVAGVAAPVDHDRNDQEPLPIMSVLTLALRTDQLADGAGAAIEALSAPGRWQSPDGRLVVAVATSPSGIDRDDASEFAHRIGEAYQANPESWPTVAGFPLAVAIVDLDRRRALAGIDAAGLHQMYWEHSGNRLVVGTRLAPLLAARGGRPGIDPQAIYDYVYFHCIPSPRTIFSGIGKLPAGHHLCLARNELDVRRHFHVEFDDHPPRDVDELGDELLAELDRSVGRAMRPGANQGAFLSGGLDSSTVAGLFARRRSPERAPTFSIGFNAAGYDEIEYARLAARHFGTEAHEYYVTPDDIFAAVRDIAAAFDEPFGNSSAIPVYFCARLAREAGVDRMLAGDGGDELFAGNSRYAKQLKFEHYGRIPGPIRRGVLEPLLLESPAGRLPLVRKAASYARQAKISLPDRLQSYNYLHRHDPAEIFARPVLDNVNVAAPLEQLRSEYEVHHDTDAVNRMLFLDWKFTLHDNDLVKVNSMCSLAGMDVGYPMLDEELIRLSCRVPASLKLHRGQLRWFYKHATRRLLPPEIIAKKKHGFGLPFGVWLKDHDGLRRLATESLGALRDRGLFNPDFLPELLRLHADVHPAYYGEMVWVLLLLELWLQAHEPAAI